MLSERGIEAVPLCDRVEVADEAWRDALEAFLGGHREALSEHNTDLQKAQQSDRTMLTEKQGESRIAAEQRR